MKNRFFSFALAGVITLGATTGCKDDKPEEQPASSDRIAVNLTANIKSPSISKVANGQWEGTDRVGLIMKQTGSFTAESVYEDTNNVQMSIAEGALKSTPPVLYPLTGKVDFVAYYPYTANVGANFTIPVNVAGQAEGLAVDVLYSGNATNQSPVATPVALNFNSSLAKIIVTVTGDYLTESDLAGMSVSVGDMFTKANLQLKDGTFTGHSDKKDIALYRKESTATSAVFEALLLPVAGANATYTFTVNGKGYSEELLKNGNYAAATQYEISAHINKIGSITIFQVTPAHENILFSINGQTATVNGEPFTPEFTVTTNKEWTAVSDEDWLTVIQNTTDNTFTLSVGAANTGTQPLTAIVTVTAGDAPSKYITVTQACPIQVTNISVTPSSLELWEDENATLTTTLLPTNHTEGVLNNSLKWSSSNTAVATVDEDAGVVTAVGEGTATITVVLDRKKEVTANISVTVAKTLAEKQKEISGLVGLWEYTFASNLEKATIGNNLVAYKMTEERSIGNPSKDGIRQVAGFKEHDYAVEVDQGSLFLCNHGIPATTSNGLVGEWTILWDVKRPAISDNKFCSLLETRVSNSTDLDCTIRPTGQLGVGGSGISANSISNDTWYRIVVVMKDPEYYRIYVNGVKWLEGLGTFVSNERSKLETAGLLLMADDNGEDNLLHVSTVAIWNRAISETEITSLGNCN